MPDWIVAISSPTMSSSLTLFSSSNTCSGFPMRFAFSFLLECFQFRRNKKIPSCPQIFLDPVRTLQLFHHSFLQGVTALVLKSINMAARNLLLDVSFPFSLGSNRPSNRFESVSEHGVTGRDCSLKWRSYSAHRELFAHCIVTVLVVLAKLIRASTELYHFNLRRRCVKGEIRNDVASRHFMSPSVFSGNTILIPFAFSNKHSEYIAVEVFYDVCHFVRRFRFNTEKFGFPFHSFHFVHNLQYMKCQPNDPLCS